MKTILISLMLQTAWLQATHAQIEFSNFIEPDSATPVFEDWSRGDSQSTFVGWEDFISTETNPPSLPTIGPSGANVAETTGTGFLTGSMNIYSFSTALAFDIDFPAFDLGSGVNTRVVLQLATLGEFPLHTSVNLSFASMSGTVDAMPDYVAELDYIDQGAGGPGGGGAIQQLLFAWDVDGYNPAEFQIGFEAFDSSMSLDYLTIDTFATPAGLTPLPNGQFPGDYNGDRQVDLTDYLQWKAAFGSGLFRADGNRDGIVNLADYTVWRNNLGASGQTLSGVSNSLQVPEPSTITIVGVMALIALCVTRLNIKIPRTKA